MKWANLPYCGVALVKVKLFEQPLGQFQVHADGDVVGVLEMVRLDNLLSILVRPIIFSCNAVDVVANFNLVRGGSGCSLLCMVCLCGFGGFSVFSLWCSNFCLCGGWLCGGLYDRIGGAAALGRVSRLRLCLGWHGQGICGEAVGRNGFVYIVVAVRAEHTVVSGKVACCHQY